MAQAGLIGAGKENVLIRAGACSITVLPNLGGKVSSIRVHGRELLQPPLSPLAPRTRTMSFDAGDASGWDECLPSVAACTVLTENGPAHIPDHGELWRVEWEKQGIGNREQGIEDRSASLRGECFSLPLVLERRVALSEVLGGWRLYVDYTLTNSGCSPAPWSWAAHPLFTVEPGDQVILPGSIQSLRLEGSGGKRLGNTGDTVHWPIARLVSGALGDLSVAQAPESGIGDKLFAGPLTEVENWCALERPSAGVRIKMNFDPAANPYLGLWFCYGGWPERPGPKQVCVAMEPSTAPVDSLAETGPWSRVLAPGESSQWNMHVNFELI